MIALVLLVVVAHIGEGATITSEIIVNSITVGTNIASTADARYFRYNRQGSAAKIPAPIYTRSLADGTPYVAWTDGSTVHISELNCRANTVENEMTVAGEEVRGLVVHDDGSVAVLVRRVTGGDCTCSTASCPGTCGEMYHVKFNPSGGIVWNRLIDHRIYAFSLGNSVLESSDNADTPEYGMYYKVSSTNTMCGSLEPGHQGDTMKFWDVASGPEASYNQAYCPPSPGFYWGCSHSMELRFVWNPYLKTFGAACITDAYPSPTGYYWWNSKSIFQTDGYGNGYTDGGLGDLVATPTGFALTLTAPKVSGTYGTQCTDVKFVTLDSVGNVLSQVWLTSGTDCYEFSKLAEYGTAGNFLVGWLNQDTSSYYIAEINAAGAFVRNPEDVSSTAIWQERESWITFPNGDVGWAFVWNTGLGTDYFPSNAGGNQLRVVKVAPGGSCSDCSFDGNGPGGLGCGYGACVDGTPDDRSFTCDCSGVPYTGTNCEIVTGDCTDAVNGPNSRDCGSGRCVDDVIGNNDFSCDCSTVPYTGANCNNPILDCATPANGPGGSGCGAGTCVDGIPNDGEFTCNCAGIAFAGFNCEIATSLHCAEGGVRIAGGVQRPGYNGDWARMWGGDVSGRAHYTRGGSHLYSDGSRWYFDSDTSTSGYLGYVYSSHDFPTDATNTPSIWPGTGGFNPEPAMTIECIPSTDPCPALFGAQDASGVYLLAEWPATARSASANLGCPSGYSGTITRTCGSNGAWEAPVGDCVPGVTSCSTPASFPHATGLSACDGTAQGATCSFSCSAGYSPAGTLTCSGGSWSGSPSCAGNACSSAPSSFANAVGLSACAGTAHDGTCAFTCSGGLTPTGTLTCSAGSWGGTASCTGVSGCGHEDAATGELNSCLLDSEYLDECDWTCAVGYTGTARTRTCGAGGVWSGSTISCSDVDECAGSHDCDVNAACTNNVGSFSCACNTGYSGNGRTCAVHTCTLEVPSSTGQTLSCVSDSEYLEECSWGCAAGFSGTTTTRTCGVSGVWSGTHSTCEADCTVPSVPGGTWSGAGCSEGAAVASASVCTFVADGGVTCIEEGDRTCTDGVWDANPACGGACPLPSITGGTWSGAACAGSTAESGVACSFVPGPGYECTNVGERTCDLSVWDLAAVECSDVDACVPDVCGTVDSSAICYDGVPPSTTHTCGCSLGFTFDDVSRECILDTASLPCDLPVVADANTVSLAACAGTLAGESCSFTCTGGATPSGTLICTAGAWNAPTCIASACPTGTACTPSDTCFNDGVCDGASCIATPKDEGGSCMTADGVEGTCVAGACTPPPVSNEGIVLSNDEEESGGASTGMIAGIIVGVVCCIAVVAAVAIALLMRDSKQPQPINSSMGSKEYEVSSMDPYSSQRPPPTPVHATPPAAAAPVSRPNRPPPGRPAGPPPPPATPKGEEATALYDYQDPHGVVSFFAGDLITVLERLDDGWARGLIDGREGHFPISYIKVHSKRQAPPPGPPMRSPAPVPAVPASERAPPHQALPPIAAPPRKPPPKKPPPKAAPPVAPKPSAAPPVSPKPAGRGGRGGRGRGGRGPPPRPAGRGGPPPPVARKPPPRLPPK